jgi:hypothetical protein
VCAHVVDHLLVDSLGRAPERELPQRRQVARLEVVPNRPLGLFGNVDLSFLQALDQIFGRQVDQLDFIRIVENRVGHGLAHLHVRDLGDNVVQAVDMLDIQRRMDVDACFEQLAHIEIALGMPASRRVGVRELVDEGELRLALQDRVEVHLGEHAAFVTGALLRNDLEALGQHFRFDAAVRLDNADDDVDAF